MQILRVAVLFPPVLTAELYFFLFFLTHTAGAGQMVRKKTPLRSGKRNELSLVSTKNEWFPCQHSSFGYVRKNVGRRKPVIFTWWDQGRPRRSTAVRQTMISFLFSKRNRMSFVIGCKLLRTSRSHMNFPSIFHCDLPLGACGQ